MTFDIPITNLTFDKQFIEWLKLILISKIVSKVTDNQIEIWDKYFNEKYNLEISCIDIMKLAISNLTYTRTDEYLTFRIREEIIYGKQLSQWCR